MATNIKLSNPITGYSIFKTNQLLTANHLNSIGQFFDYQDRLTRSRLLGVGIVCGLQVNLNTGGVTLSKGVGVTSDGDLLSIDGDTNFAGIAPYSDKEAHYDPFKFLLQGRDTPGIWQFTTNDKEDGYMPIEAFLEKGNIPSDFVVVLYVSQYVKNTDNCTGDGCDGKADMYTNDINLLLVNKNDYAKIGENNNCGSDSYFDLPEASIPRILLNERDTIFSYGDLITVYGNAISNSVKILDAPLKASIDIAILLQNAYLANGGLKAFFTSNDTGALFQLQDIVNKSISEKRQGIQYVYDMLKDVCNAYNEFKESAFELCYGCCISPEKFPKHLFLGLLQNADLVQNKKYRTHFIESPILNNKNADLENVLNLFVRLIKLITYFVIPQNMPIRITPSVDINQPLAKKSIPYYFDIKNVLSNWSPSATKRNKTGSILSYDAVSYATLPHITDPLSYDIDKYPFFRIEGHIGKTYDTAYTTIDNLIQQYDLPFEIAGVQLQKERIRFIPPKFIRPGVLNLMYDKERLLLNTKLDFVKKYNESLAQNLPDDKELEQPAITKLYGDPKALKTLVLNKKIELDTQIIATKDILSKPVMETIGNVAWDDIHLTMANAGAQISKNSKLFTSAAYRSPIESLAVLDQPKTLQWLGDLLLLQKQKVEDGYIFSNFLKQNPSMLHNAGVCKGGTFILVYDKTGDIETVVADFYLPYIAKAELVESNVEPSTVTVRPSKDIDFTISKDIIKRPILNSDIFNISDQLIKVKDLTSQSGVLLNQKINEFDGRINKVGEKVLMNEQSIVQQVGVVKDKYESSFSKLVSSYDTVVTKSNIRTNADTKLADFTKDDLDNLITGVRTEFNGKLDTIDTKMSSRILDVSNDINNSKALIQKANADITVLDGKITNTRNDLATKSDLDIKNMNDRITSVSNGVDAKITQNGTSLDTKMNVAISGLEQKLSANTQSFDQKLANTRSEILTTADKAATDKLNLQKQNIDASITKLNGDIIRIKPR